MKVVGCLCVHFSILRLTPLENFAFKLTQTFESAFIYSLYSVYTINTQDINVKNVNKY